MKLFLRNKEWKHLIYRMTERAFTACDIHECFALSNCGKPLLQTRRMKYQQTFLVITWNKGNLIFQSVSVANVAYFVWSFRFLRKGHQLCQKKFIKITVDWQSRNFSYRKFSVNFCKCHHPCSIHPVLLCTYYDNDPLQLLDQKNLQLEKMTSMDQR